PEAPSPPPAAAAPAKVPVSTAPRAPPQPELPAIDPEEVLKSVFRVETEEGFGTAFVLGEQGLLITNQHVLGDQGYAGREVTLVSGSVREKAKIVVSSRRLDLGILECAPGGHCAKQAPLPFAEGAQLKVGQTVYAVGTPAGLDLSVSRGIISHTGRKVGDAVFLQTDLAVNPGNSGGPLLDEHGRVVGVVTAKLARAEGIGFATPIEYLAEGFHPGLAALMRQPDWVGGLSPEMRQMITRARPLDQPMPAPAEAPARPKVNVNAPTLEATDIVTNGRELGLRFWIRTPEGRPLRSDRVTVHAVFKDYQVDLGDVAPDMVREREGEGMTYRYEIISSLPRRYYLSGGITGRIRVDGIGTSDQVSVKMISYGPVFIR
ncbi:MAG: trypsin-like peptidase domain-containing protein, partial [Myxococcales bacterium]|nr:trypsin-like peptidase domain-containing protein [Myxococcales bacterium]